MQKPKVSIITPVYNRTDLLFQMIESIENQTVMHWELIIVDDGSDNDILEELKEYIDKESRIKLVERNSKAKGAPVCRNIGWRLAKSEFIIFLDSDDLLAPWALSERIEKVKEFGHPDMLIFDAIEFDNNDEKHHRLRSFQNNQNPLKEFLDFESCWQTTCVLWQKSALELINGWDENAVSWQDGEIHIRALLKGLTYKWANTLPDTFIRKHNDELRISNERSVDKLISLITLYQKIERKIIPDQLKLRFRENYTSLIFSLSEIMNPSEIRSFITNVETLKIYRYKTLKIYLKLIILSNVHPLIFKLMYQLRKLGLFNFRKNLFNKRRYIASDDFKALRSKLLDNDFKMEQINFLNDV